jgi:hypothetical protein
MVVKEYIKGKKLTELEKLKVKLEELIDSPFNYLFRYEVNYCVSMEITPTIRNKDITKIKADFFKIQNYLIKNKIKFSLAWWGDFIKLNIRDD